MGATRRAVPPFVLLLALVACGSDEPAPEPEAALFVPTVAYDTVAVIGGAAERNPLFIFDQAMPSMLDERTVVLTTVGDTPGGLIVADPVTGEGWQVRSARGDAGPGEFAGQPGQAFPHRDTVHAVVGQTYHAWTADGTHLRTARYEEPWWDSESHARPVGLMGDRAVVWFQTRPRQVEGEQEGRQGLRLYDPGEGLIAEITEPFPPLVWEGRSQGGNAMGYTTVDGDGFMPTARGRTIVVVRRGERRVTVYDRDGREIATRELDFDVLGAFVDAEERVWVRVAGPRPDGSRALGAVVFDRELTTELHRVDAANVEAASGRTMVVPGQDDLGTYRLVFLRIREDGSG